MATIKFMATPPLKERWRKRRKTNPKQAHWHNQRKAEGISQFSLPAEPTPLTLQKSLFDIFIQVATRYISSFVRLRVKVGVVMPIFSIVYNLWQEKPVRLIDTVAVYLYWEDVVGVKLCDVNCLCSWTRVEKSKGTLRDGYKMWTTSN